MKTWLLWTALLACHMAAAQSAPAPSFPSATVLPPLPESSFQATMSTTTVGSVAGVRYQYQLVHLDN